MYCGSSDNVRAQRLLARPLRDQPGGQEASVAAARCLPLRSSRGFPGASCGVPRESAAKNPLRRNEMKYAYGLALVAALVFGCSSSSKSTRTSSNEGKSGTVETTGSTAGTQANAQGSTATTSTASSANNNTGTDTNAQGSTSGSMSNQPSSGAATASDQGATSSAYGTPSSDSSQASNTGATGTGTASTSDQSGSSHSAVTSGPSADTSAASSQTATNAPGQSSTPGSTSQTGPTYGQSGESGSPSSGAYGSTGPGSTTGTSSDQGNLRTVTGSVARVDQNSITLDQSAGGVTLTVDSQTQVLRRGQPVAAGISAIREGTQVRASFDPASNRADKIEVMGRARRHSKGSSTSSGTTEQGKANSGDQTTTPK